MAPLAAIPDARILKPTEDGGRDLTMAAGMPFSVLRVGEGGSFRAPVAIPLIGWIIASMVLSLMIVPSVFHVMDDLQRSLSRIFGHAPGRRDEKEQGSRQPP